MRGVTLVLRPLVWGTAAIFSLLPWKHFSHISNWNNFIHWRSGSTPKEESFSCDFLKKKSILFIVLYNVFQRLDVEKETIELVHCNPTETRDLPRRVPKDTPRYHFFLYKHSHEGDYLESVGTSLIQPGILTILFFLHRHKMYRHEPWGEHLDCRHWQKTKAHPSSSTSTVHDHFGYPLITQ